MPLCQRVFRCERCGLEIDRDLNAARKLHAAAPKPLQRSSQES
ncbi:zinc ribbon domain-containing protein [Synechococcus sp. O70.1]